MLGVLIGACLGFVAASLVSAFAPFEIESAIGVLACVGALVTLTLLSRLEAWLMRHPPEPRRYRGKRRKERRRDGR